MKFKTKVKVITKNEGVKSLEKLKIGDLVKCEDGEFYPIKNILTASGSLFFYRLSNNISFYLSPRVQLKTPSGFKIPELWDELKLQGEITPQIVQKKIIPKIVFFNDILIDNNMVTPEGIVFTFRT